MKQRQFLTHSNYLQNISRGSATVHVLISSIHSYTSEAAAELSQLHITWHQLVCEVVILPHIQVVVAACDKLGPIVVQEFDSDSKVCACGSATDGVASLHIPKHLWIEQSAEHKLQLFIVGRACVRY